VGNVVAAGNGRDSGSPDPFPAVAVAGGGSIGVAWALVFARAGLQVSLYDPAADRRAAAPAELTRRLTALDEAGLLAEDTAAIAGRVTVTTGLDEAVGTAGYVQECAPESLEVKRELFARLDRSAPPGAVLASSSSALTCSAIADGLSGAGRCLIAHPGNPPYLLRIVELVPGPATAPATVEKAAALLTAAGMAPVRLRREIAGFVFNRLQGAVLREAYCLVRDGVVAPEDVDLVMRAGLGRRWSVLGPFETIELNTRGGIDAHARIMGPAYARMGAERGQSDPWEPELVSEVSASVRRRFPREAWEDNVAWRDQALMVLERCWREHQELSGPPAAEPPAAEPPVTEPLASGPAGSHPAASDPAP
jgi:L-gulonate 3-dehydrogenase